MISAEKMGWLQKCIMVLNAIIDVYINRKDYKRAGYYIQMMRQKQISLLPQVRFVEVVNSYIII